MEIKKPTVAERQKAFYTLVQKEAKLLLNKGQDYTAGKAEQDAYANFRIIADLLDGAPITPYTIAMVYALKHVFSLITFCKTGKQESGEGLEGRHMDVRNYAFILNEIVADHLKYFELANKIVELTRGVYQPEWDGVEDPPTHTDEDFAEPWIDRVEIKKDPLKDVDAVERVCTDCTYMETSPDSPPCDKCIELSNIGEEYHPLFMHFKRKEDGLENMTSDVQVY